MEITEVRKLVGRMAEGQGQTDPRVQILEALLQEQAIYAELCNRPGAGRGWVVHKEPMHRLREQSEYVVATIKQTAQEWPLTTQIIVHAESGTEWWAWRSVNSLTDEELCSGLQYMERFQQGVQTSEWSDREFEDSATVVLIQIKGALGRALHSGVFNDRVVGRWAGLIASAIQAGTAIDEALRRAFKWETDGVSIQERLARVATVVPAVADLTRVI